MVFQTPCPARFAGRGGRGNEIRSLRKCSFARSSCSVQGGGAAVSHCCVAQ
ncbi:hypothetical protein FAEPRAA2165_00241 [Faecalibacterium duncaniae]|uniref:Uncharacterized protein n=1 Tax=Faecalibacterium duncaniae (strain DSM 17677 / JCM 31915 / A2-165) TaxID=411483 RepID=C7H1V1_FAED2|nr:hypothetical protein FAEPRAA2165_00241 [Faecalibacterium duncaniae]